MKNTFHSILRQSVLGLVAATLAWPTVAAEPKKLLLVTVTTGFRHSSIPTAEKVIQQLGKDSGAFTVDLVQQPPDKNNPNFKEDVAKVLEKLSPANLAHYDGVIFANTTGDLPLPDRDAFLKWIESGKAFIGMHSASDTFHGFRPFIEMLGGEFQSHGAQATVDCMNEDMQHPCCKHLGSSWTVHDEIYLMKSFDPKKVRTLLGLDKEPNKKTPGYFPVSWCKEHGKGKVFYTSLGHREDVWDDKYPDRKNSPEVAKAYQEHILNGIKWALGLVPGDAQPHAK
jgi:uncharacterized protein